MAKIEITTLGDRRKLFEFSKTLDRQAKKIKKAVRDNLFSFIDRAELKSNRSQSKFLKKLINPKTIAKNHIAQAILREMMFDFSSAFIQINSKKVGSVTLDDTRRLSVSHIPISIKYSGLKSKFRGASTPVTGRNLKKESYARRPSKHFTGFIRGDISFSGVFSKLFLANSTKNFRKYGDRGDYRQITSGTRYTFQSKVPSLYDKNNSIISVSGVSSAKAGKRLKSLSRFFNFKYNKIFDAARASALALNVKSGDKVVKTVNELARRVFRNMVNVSNKK